MGGFGSGGTRVGAGRKSKGARVLALHGGRNRSGAGKQAQAVASEPLVSVDPPETLTEAQRTVWVELAPHALAAHTLTAGTAGSFADLCQAIVTRDSLLALIEADGWTFVKALMGGDGEVIGREIKKHPLVADQRGWEQRVEAGRARFRLAPLGKEIVASAKVEDPFAEFDGEVAR